MLPVTFASGLFFGEIMHMVRLTLITTILASTASALLLSGCSAAAADGSPKWNTDVAAALKVAATENRPLLVLVTADWCGYCRKMEQETFTTPRLAGQIRDGFVALRINADQHPELVQRLKVEGFPSLLVFSSNGNLVDRTTGYLTATEASKWLETVAPVSSNAWPRLRPASAEMK